MKPLLVILAVVASGILAQAEEVPNWVLNGILGVETSSFYHQDGTLHYANRKRGRHGELGPWQMTPAAFLQVRKKGESFERLATDPAYARLLVTRYLLWLNAQVKGDWDQTVRAYNVGLAASRNPRRGKEYLADVRAWAKQVAALPKANRP